MFWQRLLTAAIGMPAALVLAWLGGWYLAAAVALLTVVSLRELYRMAFARRREGSLAHSLFLRSAPAPGYAFGVLVPMACLALPESRFPGPYFGVLGTLLGLTLVVALVRFGLGRARTEVVVEGATVFLGTLYLPVLFGYAIHLRQLASYVELWGVEAAPPPGACWLTLVLAACWAEDIAAYVVGKKLGRRKLCPSLSPAKTVEGAIAGLAGSVLVTAALGAWFGLPVTHGLALGALMGVAGQLGDLSESALKRRAGVKDAGAILPGHGGVLDRFDSLLFNGPLAFYYLRLVFGG